jgi:hypothetical protein
MGSAAKEGAKSIRWRGPWVECKEAESRDVPNLLRVDGERLGEEHRTRTSKESAPPDHWMTSSARASRDGGIVSPRALAVLRLMTSSNFVGCSTGRSAGLAPFRILST